MTLRKQYNVVSGNGAFTEVQKLHAFASEYIPMLQAISNDARMLFGNPSSAKEPLNRANDNINKAGIPTCIESECVAAQRKVLIFV